MPRKPAVLIVAVSVSVAMALSQAAVVPADARQDEAAVPQRPDATAMLNAWQSLAIELGPEAMGKMGFALDGDERTAWFYTPVDRTGFPIGEMNDAQQAGLRKLLNTGLGESGTGKVFDVVALEEVLYATSGGREMRNPGNYYLSTFGMPSNEQAWGWRFEGHHMSVNFTVIDNHIVAATPAFFGGNPATVGDEYPERQGFSPFSREEELGRRLLQSFTADEMSRVIIADEAPRDILTTNSAYAEMGAPEGVSIENMSDEQRALFRELFDEYAARLHASIADYQLAKIRQAGAERVHFAWAGGIEPGEPHYYRIHGPTFVIEYDNTQNNANHVHSAWRDFDDDFGGDPLRAHLAHDHGLKIAGFTPRSATDLGKRGEIVDDEQAHRRAHAAGTAHQH